MADEVDLQDDGGGNSHTTSPFFTKLPFEIRYQIYHETFKGSKMTLRTYMRPTVAANRKSGLSVSRRGAWDASQSLHWSLLTCHQFYEEALPVYWSETKVASRLFRPSRLSNDHFLGRVPEYARAHIKTLGGIKTRPYPRSDAPEPLDKFLHHFPRLKVCALQARGLCGIHLSTVAVTEREWTRKVLEITERSSNELLSEDLVTSHKAEIVQKWLYFVDNDSRAPKAIYINHTTGKKCIVTVTGKNCVPEDPSSWVDHDDDEYFQRILKKDAVAVDDLTQYDTGDQHEDNSGQQEKGTGDHDEDKDGQQEEGTGEHHEDKGGQQEEDARDQVPNMG